MTPTPFAEVFACLLRQHPPVVGAAQCAPLIAPYALRAIVAAMPNYRRAFAPGGCWFFTVNLLDRRRRFLAALAADQDRLRQGHSQDRAAEPGPRCARRTRYLATSILGASDPRQ